MSSDHDPITAEMRTRLKTTSMALGLARLLQDARRPEEVRGILSLLEDGGAARPADVTSGPEARRVTRVKVGSRRLSFLAMARQLNVQ